MTWLPLAFSLISIFSFGQSVTFLPVNTGTSASFRGLSVVDDNNAWVSGSKGWIGSSIDGGITWGFHQPKGYEQLDFRSIYAFNGTTAIAANAGSPAYVLKTTDGGRTWKEVYKNATKAAFIDGVDFWNAKEGIVFGDPIDSRMLMLRTSDGGEHWVEQELNSRPELKEGEASFAASGTTIRCIGKKEAAIATGGKISRLWITKDQAKSWEPRELPIIQSASSQGVFSVAFNGNLKTSVIVGGDFQQDSLTTKHVFYSNDSGLNWNFPITPTRGYRECVEYISKTMLLSTGPRGTDVSYDGGKNWAAVSDEKPFHVIRKARKGKLIVMAGGAGKVSVIKVGK